MKNETICALSTPRAAGALAVVRLSGHSAIGIINSLFSQNLSDVPSHTVHVGKIRINNSILDEVVISVFRAPHSYTGEDVVEISCHGSMFIVRELMHALLGKGARPAGPGEFTQRAFLNGKFDLSQAEAVADLIASQSGKAHALAMQQMRGGYSRKITALRQELVKFASLLELELDFSEEDVEFASRDDFSTLLKTIKTEVNLLIESFSLGRVLKEGLPVVIAGVPNVGKSTLLNALLREEKAIVSEIPGTTRDAIEDVLEENGILFRFIDTAGLRKTSHTIEKKGIEKTWEKIKLAAVIIYLFDAREADTALLNLEDFRKKTTGQYIIPVANKMDVYSGTREWGQDVVLLSAREEKGIDRLRKALVDYVRQQENNYPDIIITNARHLDALQRVRESLQDMDKAMKQKLPGDLLAVHVREALYSLGLVTAAVANDELLDFVFSRFCIGK